MDRNGGVEHRRVFTIQRSFTIHGMAGPIRRLPRSLGKQCGNQRYSHSANRFRVCRNTPHGGAESFSEFGNLAAQCDCERPGKAMTATASRWCAAPSILAMEQLPTG